MKLPNFLIIGAMKSGTTTLYDDLRHHPSVFFPIDKEPDFFSKPDSTSADAVAEYARMFRKAEPGQLIGEASTGYTKRPTNQGVAERAREVLGEGLKAIYIVRDPVRRAISHHHHDHGWGFMSPDIDQAVKDCPELVSYSRYAYQVEPWIEALGSDNLLILRFEDYVKNRQAGYDRVCDWLGLERRELDDPTRKMNVSSNKPVLGEKWAWIAHNRLYRNLIRPIMPGGLKALVTNTFLPRSPDKLNPPSQQTLRHLVDSLRGDVDHISKLMGCSGPAWDLDRHLEHATQDDPTAENTAPPAQQK